MKFGTPFMNMFVTSVSSRAAPAPLACFGVPSAPLEFTRPRSTSPPLHRDHALPHQRSECSSQNPTRMCRPSTAATCVCLHRLYLSRLSVSDGKTVGIFIFSPTIPAYPQAKFPGVVVFSEIYQGVYGRYAAAAASRPAGPPASKQARNMNGERDAH